GVGHGDTKHVLLFPSSIEECFEFGWKAHDLADQLQTPVIVLSDLDLGMNNWMGEPFAYPEEPLKRGKVLSAEEVERLETFRRYADVDGDGIPYRTLPGNQSPRSAWFGRGTGHDENARYSEDGAVWWRNTERLARKHETARQHVPTAVIQESPGARLGVICYGTTRYAIEEARDALALQGVAIDVMRLRALPFGAEVEGFVAQHEDLLVIEMNRDNQLRDILRAELPQHAAKLHGVGYIDGMPLTAAWVERQVLGHLNGRVD